MASIKPTGGVEFPKSPDAQICGFSLALPRFSLGLNVDPGLLLPLPPLPTFHLSFALSCDPSHPVDLTGGVEFGGGRTPNNDPSPDLEHL